MFNLDKEAFDLKSIEEQVKKVISYSQGYEEEDINTTQLINSWFESKADFIKAMGGRLIWESPEEVSFPLGEKEKINRAYDFSDRIYRTYHNYSLSRFIDSNLKNFYSNSVEEDYCDYPGKKIPKGMKLIKAFKYFEPNKTILDEIQTEASQLIQENKICGKLCFSVHPLDFLSSSENTYNWRSCHALDGEYRAGNLSYMMDNTTVICYLKGADGQKLPHFPTTVPWNSKKWRVLLFLSTGWDMISVGRQYPFTSNNGAEIVKEKFLEIIGKNGGSYPPLSDYLLKEDGITPHIRVRDRLFPLVDVVFDCDNPLHYNDMLYSNFYTIQYSYDEDKVSNSAPIMHVGHPVFCLACNEKKVVCPDTMLCPDCDNKLGNGESEMFAICDCCGQRYYREDQVYVTLPNGDNDYVCPTCAEQACSICENCGEYYYDDDILYDRNYEDYVCTNCYDMRREREREEY